LNINSYLRVRVVLRKSNTALVISRYVNQTWLAFVGVGLGSVFGLLGTVAGIMKVVEILSDKVVTRIDKKVNLQNKIRKNRFFKDNFGFSKEYTMKPFPPNNDFKNFDSDKGKIMLSTIN